ncbi:ribosome silencing factor [Pectinatus cerevisiiphilus]|uniref:Ribosomal silencing factor RsfS n=1 Tax=Pectinatus cerevisiiphilus TaxID=86956 RepID=A0A4R3K5C9_9FIRM|nr:ribosome silencing factor [Pectinatus cerevisiiphilus]TCS77996.1 ribosome-associated protein [Pectinatus cerevisiiphilus]
MIFIINLKNKDIITPLAKSKLIAKAADDKKASRILIMDMRELTTSTDYFIVCNGGSSIQAKAIADNIEEQLGLAGEHLLHREGYKSGEWILLDFGDCVAHIFTEESREFYGLENLWGDAGITEYEQ